MKRAKLRFVRWAKNALRKPKTFPGRGRSPQKKASRKVREVREVFIGLTLAAEATKNQENAAAPPSRWFAGVFAR
ncbi:MAG: hypothetical protein IJQ39_14505 [Thermoguttaceae bacterium]|nr:hypothetical protein [Thermoguttaceae bacterium]